MLAGLCSTVVAYPVVIRSPFEGRRGSAFERENASSYSNDSMPPRSYRGYWLHTTGEKGYHAATTTAVCLVSADRWKMPVNTSPVSTLVQAQTVDQIILHEELWIAFGETVQKYLCGESYWFLNEASDTSNNNNATTQQRHNSTNAPRAQTPQEHKAKAPRAHTPQEHKRF